jgi:S1-C subfamily serine protease
MKLAFLLLLVCIGGILLLLSVRTSPQSPPRPAAIARGQPSLSPAQLAQIAQKITVKVFSADIWGSGTIIQRRGDDYWVLTNDHVLNPGLGQPLTVETGDRRRHPARAIAAVNFQGNDLALLTFRSSDRRYAVASLGDSSQLREGEAVFAGGFPLAEPTFRFEAGEIRRLLSQPFKGGYQIGCTNAVQNGMSGGPLLNQQGQVIGINGRQAHPLWGNPYVFQDSSEPTARMQQQMRQLSWAIPLQTALPFISRQ